ncbi:MAG TPA: M23 family metallopeptidase [Dehalococcoidia bacterium]
MTLRRFLLIALPVAAFLLALGGPGGGRLQASHTPDHPNFSFPWPRQQAWFLTGGPHSALGSRVYGSGLDFAPAPDAPQRPVVAMADGVVRFAGFLPWTGYGNVVAVDHGDGWEVWYAHLDRIAVWPGQLVLRGRYLGEAGNTGHSEGVHVHLELFRYGRRVPWSLVTIEGWHVHGVAEYAGFLQRDGVQVWSGDTRTGVPLASTSPLILACSPLDGQVAVDLVYQSYVTGSGVPQPCPPP